MTEFAQKPTRLGAFCLASTLALAAGALPASAQGDPELLERVERQDKEIAALKAQIDKLTKLVTGQAAPAQSAGAAGKKAPPPTMGQTAASNSRLDALEETVAEQGRILSTRVGNVEQRTQDGKLVMTGPLPRFESSNGNFTAGLRALVQFDAGHYMQNDVPAGAAGPDLNSGFNFRRARLGIEGTLYKVWSYNFTGEFGGSGSEQPVQLQQAFVQYNGFAPFAIRAGAFSAYAGLEDSTPVGDVLFLERATATEISRNISAGDGRYGVSLVAQGERYLASIAYMGSKVNGTTIAQTFDEQQGIVGRIAALAYNGKQAKIVVGANGSYVFDTADTAAGAPGAGNFTFSNSPELRVDDTGTNNAATSLVTTGAITARQVTQWGVDAAMQWKSLYAEGGYFKFGADRYGSGTPATSNPDFDAWYAQASWVITGESRRYAATSAAFRAPKVTHPVTLGSNSGWGAWELAGRYSVTDLNFNPGRAGAATPAGGIRGGEQDIWTVGVNWYPNDALRFTANYYFISVDRLSATGTQVGQDLQAIGIRSQLAF